MGSPPEEHDIFKGLGYVRESGVSETGVRSSLIETRFRVWVPWVGSVGGFLPLGVGGFRLVPCRSCPERCRKCVTVAREEECGRRKNVEAGFRARVVAQSAPSPPKARHMVHQVHEPDPGSWFIRSRRMYKRKPPKALCF